MCGGMGYYEEIKPSLLSKIISTDFENQNTIKKSVEVKKENNTPSYIINNARFYNQKTFINLLEFLNHKLNKLTNDKNIETNSAEIETLNNKIISVKEILRLKLYGIDKGVKIKKKEAWIQFNTIKKKESKKLEKWIESKIQKKKENKAIKKNKEVKPKKIKIIRSTIGDLFKLGLVKPLKK
jgi:hypothetical protein